MQTIQIFQYKETPMEFEVINGEVFANATAMCQAFGKRPVDWIRLPQTERYVSALKVKWENLTSLIETRKGKSNDFQQGTWIHEKLILKLAQWLEVDFEIWCDEKIAELLRTGKVEIAPPKTQAELFLESAQMLVAQEKRINAIETKMFEIEAKTTTRPDYFTVVGYATMNKIQVGLTLATNIGRKATKLCTDRGIMIDSIPDPRFGKVGMYPRNILVEVFNSVTFK